MNSQKIPATVITGFFSAFPLVGEWIQQFLLGLLVPLLATQSPYPVIELFLGKHGTSPRD